MVIQQRDQLGGNVITASSAAQLEGLLTHVERTAARLLPDPQEQGPSAAAVRYLIDSFVRFARHYHQAYTASLSDDKKITAHPHLHTYQQHRAIEALCGYWETLVPLLYATSDPHVGLLEALVREAQPNEHWERLIMSDWETRIDSYAPTTKMRMNNSLATHSPRFITVPYFGRTFDLVRFLYAPVVSITGVPLYDLESPWDWHVVWHEMAGHLARQLERNGAIAAIVNHIKTNSPNNVWETWRALYTHAPDALPENGKDPWRDVDPAGFVAELLEDGYGIVSLGPEMLSTLDRVLAQHYQDDYKLQDTRHPPLQMRLDMAAALLLEMGISRKDLVDLGVTPEQLTRLGKLQTGAHIIYTTLVGDDKTQGYVRQNQGISDAETTHALKQQLLSDDHEIISSPSIPGLISAARLAFEEHPEDGRQIAERAIRAVTQAPTAVVGGLNRARFTIPLPDDDFFAALTSGMRWDKLLVTSFQEVDNFDPQTHGHPHGIIRLIFNSNDGTPHNISHRPAQHT